MSIEIRVDLLDPTPIRPTGKPPDGVSVTPLRSEIYNGPVPDHAALYCIITVIGSVPATVLATWISGHFIQYRPKRIKIETEEIFFKDGEIERIVKKKYEEKS
jgi:hypothetical protein